MSSSYELNLNTTNRPPIGLFPEGFFIEDYTFNNKGDLDIHNGRFCVTPDYPKGVYAYFTTLETFPDGSGPFKNYKRPAFPYVIGDTFYAKRNEFNYKTTSNQTEYDIESDHWFRNTSTYNTNNTYSGYEYIFDSNKIKKQTIDVTASSLGSLSGVGIFTGGRDYKVGDRLVFDNSQSGGRNAQGKVSFVHGKEVNTISVATTQVSGIEFGKYFELNQFVGFSSQPHNLQNFDIVNISGLSAHYKGFDGSYKVGIKSETFVTTLGIGTTGATGLTTYFYVSGALEYPFVRPNDILGIGTEKVKVLNVDGETGRLRVLREQQGTVGSAYTNRSILFEDPRKFTINVGTITTEKYFRVNEELYFEPSEAVGVGTTTGNGVGTLVTFSNPGVGASSIFIQPQAIYFKNHGLKLNDRVNYATNGGTSIGVWNGISTNFRSLDEFDALYATPITKDLIGISSHRVGLATQGGGYVGIATTTGLFFFTDTGSGDYHSFKTVRTDILRGTADKNVVTVSTATTHGVLTNDTVKMTVKPTSEQVINVTYNDYNRRIVFNPVGFTSDNVDTQNNTITVSNHDFLIGDKVIHTATTPAGGLGDNDMYYVIPFDKDRIRLVKEKYQIASEQPNFVNITSRGMGGTISKINPLVNTRRNNTLKFDLSDQSLSFLSNGVRYPAFLMSLYLDQEFNKEFLTTGTQTNNAFEVTRTGTVGISTNANLSVVVTDAVASRLYYKFDPINKEINFASKTGIIVDEESSPFNQINVELSEFDGTHRITGTSSTTFSYELPKIPESTLYTQSNSVSSYITDSTRPYGGIAEVDLVNGGNSYSRLPKISRVTSGIGTGAILEAQSNNIGRILQNRFDSDNIGFDYPTDETVRPVANLPEILEMESLTSFEHIGISSFGRNYLHPANLVVIDGYTNKVLPEVDLRYEIGDTEVTILNNTTGMYDITPRIIPTDNTNGVGISSLTFDSSSKTVRLYLSQQFSTARDFPFVVGKNVLVENVSIGATSTGTGYNSEDYEYTLFPVTAVLPQLGGSGAYIEYSLSNLLGSGEVPGTVEPFTTLGRVIPEEHFPIFNPVLTTNNFLNGETVTNGVVSGIVESWTGNIEQLKVTTPKDFEVGTIVRGESSNTQGVVMKKWDFNAEITTGVGATVVRGWQNNAGFLNDNLQRIANNEYYQNFSYSLSSKVPYEEWNEPVSNLSHTAGFAKFADYQLESTESNPGQAITRPGDSNIEVIVDIIGEADIHCTYDFDLVSEGTQTINGQLASNEIFFENKILTDYFQSIGNRVLSIDDISGQFNSNERAEAFEPIARYDSNYIFNKVFTFARDNVYTDERQFSIVNVLQSANTGYTNEYATIETYPRLGFYDYAAVDGGWDLTFNPVKFEYNSYLTSTLAYSLLDGVSGVGNTSIGDIVSIASSQTSIPSGTTTTVASFPTSIRSAKILTMVEATSGISSGQYDATEFNIIHDGTTVTQVEYGDMQNTILNPSDGIGTYHSYISGGVVKLDFIPSITGTLEAQTSLTMISDSGTTASNYDLDVARLKSTRTVIASSGSPVANIISTYSDPYSASYSVVLVEDTTNNEYEMFEFAMCNSSSNETFVEYANIFTSGSLGQVGISSVGVSNKNITYTPNAGIGVEIKTFTIDLMIFDENTNPSEIDQNNVVITSDTDSYKGTKFDLVTKFGLYHKGNEIFRRVFDGSSSSIVSVDAQSVAIPNHFFVTGEKVLYTHPGAGTTQAIGIVTASVSGVSTDKLPNTLYVVKVDDGRIQFAETSTKANALPPEILKINSVGIGASHVITSTNQNAKALVAIDNMIQAPITDTTVTTTLNQDIVFNQVFNVTGITSFASGDIIKIGNELMITESVGIAGSTKFAVRRAELGSSIESHSTGDTITKISGNYNIVGNNLNFASAPYGNTPLSTTSAASPDERDWTGITTSSSFQGRTFMRRSAVGSTEHTYSHNYVFDDTSHKFNGITTTFTLENDTNQTVGYSTDNAIILINNIFQQPEGIQAGEGTYQLEESVGVTSIRFTGLGITNGYDPNSGDIPLGGFIISVGSSSGLGYQPLVAAGGTATVSVAGTISAVSIANSGSGYRAGIQTVVNVGVQTDGAPNLEFIGTAAISGGHIVSVAITNPGSGYTSTNPPSVVFDDPMSYYNIPVEYSSSGPTGAGQSATVNIVVGQGSSVIDFEFRYGGFGYGEGETLTVPIGGPTGIPTDPSIAFEEFHIDINKIFTDNFSGWSIGQLEVLDKFDSLFDGITRDFRLLLNSQPVSIQAAKGSNIEVDQTLLIFINDILQEPGKGFVFTGGSTVEFTEPPKQGDTSKVLFYKGSGDVDVVFTDVLETVKVGDTLDINNLPPSQGIIYDQDTRTVTGINTLDSVQTNTYIGPGVTPIRSVVRPVTWCKQKVDKIINGRQVGKDRVQYEPLIYPASFLIQPVGFGSTEAYVDTVRPLFDSNNENQVRDFQNSITITSQDNIVGASGTAIVSTAGTITSISITNVGLGYTVAPSVTIGSTLGVSTIATATASITSGTVTSVTITNGGVGYTGSQVPTVLIEPPKINKEQINVSSYEGDYGTIVGFGTTTIGTDTRVIFDLFIDTDSFLRNTGYVGSAITVSGISTGDFFTAFNTEIGDGTIRQLATDGSTVIGITTSFCDGVWQVKDHQTITTEVIGIGETVVKRIFCNIGGFSTSTFSSTLISFDSTLFTYDSSLVEVYTGGISSSFSFGQFSWGRIQFEPRTSPREFNSYNDDGYVGISTAGLVQRSNPLKYINYIQI